MLTPDQKQKVAILLNAHIDIPLVPEPMELPIFMQAVDSVDAQLSSVIPAPVQAMLNDLGSGIDMAHADMFREKLVVVINKHVDIPFLSEESEAKMIRLVIDIIVRSMGQSKSVDSVLAFVKK